MSSAGSSDAFNDQKPTTSGRSRPAKDVKRVCRGSRFHCSVRFPGDDAAIALLVGSVVRDGELMPAEPDAVPVAVKKRWEDGWTIVALQDTPFADSRFGPSGDISGGKQLAANSISDVEQLKDRCGHRSTD